MLLCCITLSSSRENQRSAQEVARRISGAVVGEVCTKSSQDLISRQRAISGAVAGESTHKSRHTKYPSQTLIPRITLFAICLSFSSPPLHPCHFICPLLPFASFSFPLLKIKNFIFGRQREDRGLAITTSKQSNTRANKKRAKKGKWGKRRRMEREGK